MKKDCFERPSRIFSRQRCSGERKALILKPITPATALREILSDYDPPLLRLVRRKALEQLLTDDSTIPWYGQLMTAPQTIAYMVQLNDWLKKWKPEIRF